jgi:hypothetical protein
MSILPSVISNKYVRLARLEQGAAAINAYAMQPFDCSASSTDLLRRLFNTSAQGDVLMKTIS